MGQIAILGGSLLSWAIVVLTSYALEQWPQWRGPHRDGRVPGVSLPAQLPKELDPRWHVEVGLGHSSPVVAGGKIYVFSRRGENETVTCLNVSTGKQLWQYGYPAPYQVHAAAASHGKGPKSTPLVADTRLFTLGISGILTCWDAKTGKQLWQREFSKQFEKTSPLYGAAMSPVVDEEKCIVHVGGPDKGALIAVDVKTGQTLWSMNDDGPGYASPVIVTFNEVRQLITQSQRTVIGVDVEEGKLLWKIPFTTDYDQNAVTPLVYENSVILSGINKGVSRYRIEKQDEEWVTDEIWENKEVSLYMSSPVADSERLYGFSHRQKGQLFAIDLTTGTTLWTSEGRMGENASLVQIGKVLWALTTDAQLIAFKASDKQFEPLARYKVADTPVWAHPVIMSSGVLVKDESQLSFWQFSKGR